MEIALIISAISLGFASGFHCIGMCGPIALAVGLGAKKNAQFYLKNLAYQAGRIATYSALGGLLGIIGKSFEMAGLQQYVTVLAGVLLIIMASMSFGGKNFASRVPLFNRFLLKIKSTLGGLLRQSDYRSRFFTGILNGFLPCGMVYMALTASLAGGGVWQGALFMLLFGAGTLPFMFGVVVAGSAVSQAFRTKILKVIPVMMIVLGGLFIVRGMEVGIPYISPKKESLKVIHNASEAHKMGDHASCH